MLRDLGEQVIFLKRGMDKARMVPQVCLGVSARSTQGQQ